MILYRCGEVMKNKNFKPIYLIIFLIIFQCSMYFFTKLTNPDYHILTSNLDNKIPFIPYFIYFYVIWYLLLLLVPLLIYNKDKETFYKYFTSYSISIIICGIIFLIYPTILERMPIEGNNLSTNLVRLIYKLDDPAVNCLPSMHCLFCYFFIFGTLFNNRIEKKYQYGILIISILIVLSTLFIKQHIIIDAISSLIIACLCWLIVKYTKLDTKVKKLLD